MLVYQTMHSVTVSEEIVISLTLVRKRYGTMAFTKSTQVSFMCITTTTILYSYPFKHKIILANKCKLSIKMPLMLI